MNELLKINYDTETPTVSDCAIRIGKKKQGGE